MKNSLLSSPLKSDIDNKSEEFANYKAAMLEKLDGIEDLLDYVELGGGMHHHERLAARGKMPVRERIANFLDPDTPFLEISSLAAYASDYPVGGGCVAVASKCPTGYSPLLLGAAVAFAVHDYTHFYPCC